MKLYLVHTAGVGSFYTLTNNSGEAEEKVKAKLDKEDYGSFGSRKIVRIDVIAEGQTGIFTSSCNLIE